MDASGQQAAQGGTDKLLINLLHNSLHPTDNSLRNAAQQQLQNLALATPDLPFHLMAAIRNSAFDKTIRFVAAAFLKSLTLQYWKVHTEGAVFRNEVRGRIRAGLFELLDEPDTQIATQIALCIDIIVKHDYPEHWPEFFLKLCDFIQQTNSVVARLRAMLVLHFVVKSIISSKEEGPHQAQFQQIEPQLINFVASAWLPVATELLSALSTYSQSSSAEATEQLKALLPGAELCKLCFKLQCNFVLHNLRLKRNNDLVSQVLAKLLDLWKTFVTARNAIPPNPLSNHIDKFVLRISKMILKAQEQSPLTFSAHVPPFLQFCLMQVMQIIPSIALQVHPLPEQFLVNCFVFIRYVIELQGTAFGSESQAVVDLQPFFNEELISNLCKVIIFHYLIPTQQDLIDWQEDPENYINEELRCAWLEKKKACAEVLFCTIARKYSEYVCPIVLQQLLQCLQTEKENRGPLSDEEVRRKETIYFCFALAADDLSGQYVDPQLFASLMTGQFVNDIKNSDPRYKVIRRRLAQVLECWSRDINKMPSMTTTTYQMLLHLMENDDIVVRLQASVAFKIVIDDINFVPAHLEPYLEKAVQLIFKTVADIAESETNIQIIQIISVLIVQMGELIKPYSKQLIACLGRLWEGSRHNHHQKAPIIRTLITLVRSLGHKATDLYEFLLPVLQQNVDITAEDSLHVLEDGLALWHTTLRYVPFSPHMLTLYPKIMPILTRTVKEEHQSLEKSLQIIEAYILVGGESFLKEHIKQVLEIIGVILAQSSITAAEQHIVCIRIVDVLLQMFPKDVPPLMDKIFERILFLLFTYPESEGQKIGLGSFDDVSLWYLAALERLIIANTEYFLEFMHRQAGLVVQFSDRWLLKLGQMLSNPISSAPHDLREDTITLRRQAAVSLGVFFSLALSLGGQEGTELFARLPQMVGLCAAIVADVTEYKMNSTYIVIWDRSDLLEAQRKQMSQRDPVHAVELVAYLMSKVGELTRARPTDLTFEKLSSTIPPQALQFLKSLPHQNTTATKKSPKKKSS